MIKNYAERKAYFPCQQPNKDVLQNITIKARIVY